MSRNPIDLHVAALDRALRGPRRTRRGMVAEARAGLRDAADAYRAGGVAPDQAEALAVRDFGTVPEVAPSYQDELTARQGRRAAVLFAVVFPGMLLSWELLWSSGAVSRDASATPHLVLVLSVLQDVVTIAVGVCAVTLLAITFHRTVSPRPLTIAIGLTGTVGAVLCGGMAVAMNVAGGHSTAALLATRPALLPAYLVSATVLTIIGWQSLRTLRVARAG
jgi:hypothetical protein